MRRRFSLACGDIGFARATAAVMRRGRRMLQAAGLLLFAGGILVTAPPAPAQPTTAPAASQPTEAAPTQPATTQPVRETEPDTATKPAATTQPATQPQPAPPATQGAATADEPPALSPRFELHILSARALIVEAWRSNSGFLLDNVGDMLLEAGNASSEGLDVEQAAALVQQIKHWPDTSIDVVTYAPDTEGRPRWAVRFNWPLENLYARVAAVLGSESAQTIFENTTLSPRADGGYEIRLPESTLGYLIPAGASQSLLASHADIGIPFEPFIGTAETHADASPLLVCRLNLTQTEKDSGATWFSSFSAVTDVVYAARVNQGGDWVETVHVHWPPVSGLGAKAIFDKVKQTFFVPDEAFGSLVVNSVLAPGMLEGLAGFGPRMMSTGPGQFEMVGDMAPGPVAKQAHPAVCVTVLPGTGFFPVPDVVVQARAKAPNTLIEDIRQAVEKANKLFRDREQREPWHESKVANRVVFWNDGSSSQSRGFLLPASLRTVLFVTKETDAKGRERNFLVIGNTSTSPEELVKRWVRMPRPQDRRRLPTARKTYGQVWLNWKQLYRRISPYVNVGLSTVVRSTLLPDVDDIASELTDACVTMKMSYYGLTVDHRGPVPGGVLVLPAMLAFSTEEDRSGGSDLARERDASRKLKVLYHHAKLFKKDLGRWPAEVAELDGYVDFAGHPGLLRVQQSSKKRRGEWVKSLFGFSRDHDNADDEEEEDEDANIDDSLYVVEWHEGSWRLGVEPDTFEHLEGLYIDQNGTIHRVEKTPKAEDKRG